MIKKIKQYINIAEIYTWKAEIAADSDLLIEKSDPENGQGDLIIYFHF